MNEIKQKKMLDFTLHHMGASSKKRRYIIGNWEAATARKRKGSLFFQERGRGRKKTPGNYKPLCEGADANEGNRTG